MRTLPTRSLAVATAGLAALPSTITCQVPGATSEMLTRLAAPTGTSESTSR